MKCIGRDEDDHSVAKSKQNLKGNAANNNNNRTK